MFCVPQAGSAKDDTACKAIHIQYYEWVGGGGCFAF